jgi:polar amino acid transport system permease protein
MDGGPVTPQSNRQRILGSRGDFFALCVLVTGALSIGIVAVGTLGVGLLFALHGTSSLTCEQAFTSGIRGVHQTCSIVAALQSVAESRILLVGLVLGLLATASGLATYRAMSTRPKRRRAFAGAALGIQGIAIAAVVLWFRRGNVEVFAYQFLNFTLLEGQLGAFLNGAKNTIILAALGEAGGLVIGVFLSLLTLSEYRSVRAPARAYINFFRGTPLIWQLSFLYFGLALGLGIGLNSYQAAVLTFCLNIGAYSAEVFRAGIQSIERGQMDAALALGLTDFGAMRFAILPQAFRRVIPPLLNEFVGLVKDTSLIVVLGLTSSQQELFSTAQSGYSATFNATFFVAAAIGYLAVTLPLIRVVNAAEKHLRSGLSSLGIRA